MSNPVIQVTRVRADLRWRWLIEFRSKSGLVPYAEELSIADIELYAATSKRLESGTFENPSDAPRSSGSRRAPSPDAGNAMMSGAQRVELEMAALERGLVGQDAWLE